MAAWLLKTEAGSYGYADLVRDGGTEWDGVRNHAAAGHLRRMVPGDRVLIYHSGAEKAVVGTARVARNAQPDGPGGWVSVRIEPDAAVAPRAARRDACRSGAGGHGDAAPVAPVGQPGIARRVERGCRAGPVLTRSPPVPRQDVPEWPLAPVPAGHDLADTEAKT